MDFLKKTENTSKNRKQTELAQECASSFSVRTGSLGLFNI